MGKVFRLTWELNLLLSCFGLTAFCAYNVTGDPARRPGIRQLRYWDSTVYGIGKLGSTWQKTRRPPPFSHLAVLFIYAEKIRTTEYFTLYWVQINEIMLISL